MRSRRVAIPARTLPTRVWVTYADVSDLIGLQPPAIASAVKKQLFPSAVRLRGFMRIALDDVQALYSKYVWHDRLKSTVSARVFAGVMCEAGFPPAANLAGVNLWLAEDVKNAELPSQDNWEIGQAEPSAATSLAREIYAAVHHRNLEQPFGPKEIKNACPGWMPQTYKNILPRYSVGNPSKAAELFQRIGHGRYKTVAALRSSASR